MADVTNDREQVSEFWGTERKQSRIANWLEHPVALKFLHRRVSGDENVSTYAYWHRRFLQPPAGLALSLGCGFGGFERSLLGIGAVERFHAFDISEGAIEKARALAEAEGFADRVDYSVMDLNDFTLPERTYDAIFGISSVHHVLMLEPYFKQCRRALKDGGRLFLDEYIGPSRFQCAPMAVQVINRLRTMLPEKYWRNVFLDDRVVTHYENSSIETFETGDPSEAIRSAEIVSTLKLYFDVVDYKPYGGAILHMLLSGYAGNFDDSDPADVNLLEMICLLDELLEDAGAISTDFAALVAEPRR